MKDELIYQIIDADRNEYLVPDKVVKKYGMDLAKEYPGGYIRMYKPDKQEVEVPISMLSDRRQRGYIYASAPSSVLKGTELEEPDENQAANVGGTGSASKDGGSWGKDASEAVGGAASKAFGDEIGGMIGGLAGKVGDRLQAAGRLLYDDFRQNQRKDVNDLKGWFAGQDAAQGTAGVPAAGTASGKTANGSAVKDPFDVSGDYSQMAGQAMMGQQAQDDAANGNGMMPVSEQQGVDRWRQIMTIADDTFVGEKRRELHDSLRQRYLQQDPTMYYDEKEATWKKVPVPLYNETADMVKKYNDVIAGSYDLLDKHLKEVEQGAKDMLNETVKDYGFDDLKRGQYGGMAQSVDLARRISDKANTLQALSATVKDVSEQLKDYPDQVRLMAARGVAQMMQDKLIQMRIPENDAAGIIGQAFRGSDLGKIMTAMTQNDYDRYLDTVAQQAAEDPGFWKNLAKGALSLGMDWWEFIGPQAMAGAVGKRMGGGMVSKIAGDLFKRGLAKGQAQRIAQEIVRGSMGRQLGTAAVSNAVTFGGLGLEHGAVEQAVGVRPVAMGVSKDPNNMDVKSSTQGSALMAAATAAGKGDYEGAGLALSDAAGKVLEEGVAGAATGAVTGFGGPIAQKLGFGRGRAGKLLADLTGTTVNAATMTAAGTADRLARDPNVTVDDITAAGLLQDFAHNELMFAGMEGKKYLKSLTDGKKLGEYERKFGMTDELKKKYADLGLGKGLNLYEKMATGKVANRPKQGMIQRMIENGRAWNSIKPEKEGLPQVETAEEMEAARQEGVKNAYGAYDAEETARTEGMKKAYAQFEAGNLTEEELRPLVALMTGHYAKELSPVTGVGVQTDTDSDGRQHHYVNYLDKDGRKVMQREYGSQEEAENVAGKFRYEAQINQISALEDAVDHADLMKDFEGNVTNDYEQNVRPKVDRLNELRGKQKLAEMGQGPQLTKEEMGELKNGLQGSDLAMAMLYDKVPGLNKAVEKMRQGVELSRDEQQLVDAAKVVYRRMAGKTHAAENTAREYELENGIRENGLDEMLVGHSKEEADELSKRDAEEMGMGADQMPAPVDIGNGRYRTQNEQRIVDGYVKRLQETAKGERGTASGEVRNGRLLPADTGEDRPAGTAAGGTGTAVKETQDGGERPEGPAEGSGSGPAKYVGTGSGQADVAGTQGTGAASSAVADGVSGSEGPAAGGSVQTDTGGQGAGVQPGTDAQGEGSDTETGDGVDDSLQDNTKKEGGTSYAESYERGRQAAATASKEAAAQVSHDVDLADLRMRQIFPEKALRKQVYQAVSEGNVDEWLSAHGDELSDAQKDAVEKLRSATSALDGYDAGVKEATDAVEPEVRKFFEEVKDTNGNVTVLELKNGQRVYYQDGLLGNDYGTVYVKYRDQNGRVQTAQVATLDIEDMSRQEPQSVPLDETVGAVTRQRVDELKRSYDNAVDGVADVGDKVELSVDGETGEFTVAGRTKDGRVVLQDETGEEVSLSEEELDDMRRDARTAKLQAELDAEAEGWTSAEDRQAAEDAAAEEKSKQERYAAGIVGMADGKPDYSSKESQPEVVSDYLQEQYGDDREKMFTNIEGEKETLRKRADDLRRGIEQAEAWLDVNEDLDPEAAGGKRRLIDHYRNQLEDVEGRIGQWNKVRDAAMTAEERTAMQSKRKAHVDEVTLPEASIPGKAKEGPTKEGRSVPTDEEMKSAHGTKAEAEASVMDVRKGIYEDQNRVEARIAETQGMLDEYVEGKRDLSDDQIFEMKLGLRELEHERDRLAEEAKAWKAVKDRLPELYGDEAGGTDVPGEPQEGQGQGTGVERSDAYKRMVEIAQATHEMYERGENVDTETWNANYREQEELVKGMTDDELKVLYDELAVYDEDLADVVDDEIERRQDAKAVAAASAEVQRQTELVAKCRPQTDALKEAVDSGDKKRVKQAQTALTQALLVNGVGNVRLRELLGSHRPSRKKGDAWSGFNRAATKAIGDAVKAVEAKVEASLSDAGMDGVHLEWSDGHEAWWISADEDSPYYGQIESMDNDQRWLHELSGRHYIGGMPQVNLENAGKVADAVRNRLGVDDGLVQSVGSPGSGGFRDRLAAAVSGTETAPTEGQKKAGNYRKGHVSFGGYDYTVENPKGSVRSGTDGSGKPWSVTMHDTYGYVRGKTGVDGDHIDMFINDDEDLDGWDGMVYVVDQVDPGTGKFDEHKVMYGYPSYEAARKAYLSNYSPGWKGLGKMTGVRKDVFDRWMADSDRKTKPFADYARVKNADKVEDAVDQLLHDVKERKDRKTKAEGANQADPAVKKRYDNSKKITGRRGSITLANGQKITGTYVYGETSGLTPSHDPTNNFAQSEGFPVNADGTSANSRSYKDAHARAFTIGIGNDFNGLPVQNVPVVQDGVVLSGNGTTMAKRLAEQNGKDGKYYESLAENAGSFGLSAEDIEKAGFKGLVYFVPDEKMPLTSDTFDIFNKRTEKDEGNKDTAVKLAKTLSPEDVGAIIAEIEGTDGSGTLEALFNNPSAISDLMRTLMKKGIIGQNEVGALMEGENKLSSQGRDYVKNLLLGSVFSPETIEMMGEGSSLKNRVVTAIRPILRNMKLGVYSLKDEIDEAVRLMCEARTAEMTVDNLLRQGDFVKGNARDRYPSISQLMALTLEGKVDDFRNLLDDYNRQAAARNTGEADVFGDAPTKEELIKEFLDYKEWKDYDKRGKDPEGEGGHDLQGLQESQPGTSGGDGEGEPLGGGNQPSEGKDDGFSRFKEDSPEEGVVEKDRKAMTAFAEKAVGLDNAVTDDYATYGAKRTSVDVLADKLYGKERKWLSGKEAVAWHDEENRCSYELIPHRDRQGHLKSVTVVKYHDFGGGEEKVYTDVDGNPIVVKRDDGSVEMNLATWADEKEQVRNALEDGGIEPEYVDAMMAQADQVAAALADLTEKYPAFKAMQEAGATGRPILRNTGEYISWDYSFNCIKKDALNAVMDLVVSEGKSDHLGITQVEALKKVLQRHGFLTPCVMCYVEAKRKVYKQSKEMAVKWNAVAEATGLPKEWMGKDRDLSEDQRGALENLAEGKGLERVEGYQPNRSGDGIKADTIRKIAGLMLGSPKLRGLMDYAWMMSPGSFTEMYTKFGGTGLMEFMTQGQSRGKSLLEASPFSMNDIPRDLMLEMYNPVKLAELGGLRQFSYEDARALMFFDYYQQFLLMQGARAPEHLYTKRPFMPEMFGRTGAMMNQSLVVDIWPGDDWHRKALGLSEEEYEGWLDSHAGFVPKGALPKDDARYVEGSTELVPNWSVESFPVDIAMKNVHNRDFRGCVGNVVVAPNREFILWALDNPDIHQILAYHATGANPVMRSLTGYDRVKGMDDGYHTLDRNGKAVNELYVPDIGLRIEGKGLRWNTLLRRNGYDARRAAQVYLDYCKENGMTPMFCYEGIVDMSGEKAVSHPEYYKLLTDFRMYDEDGRSVRQRAVKAVLPEDWHGILERYLQEEQVGSDAVKGIRLDGGLLKEVHDVTRYVSMEPSERDAFMGLLGDIYGKDKVSVLRTKEFDATLDAATEDGRSELLRDKGGMVYGFTDGERIVLNEDVFNAHTPMHEHTHIFMKVLQAVNPRLYERGMELWRDSPLWKKAKAGLEALGEAATDDQVFSECISQFAGQENEKVISRVTGITDKGWLRKAMDWMKAMWAGVKSAFSRWTGKDLDGLTAEEFGRMPLRAVYDEKERKAYTERVRQYAEMSGKAEGNVELHADRGSGKKDEAAERRRRAGLEAAVDKIRKAGIDVSTDWKEGQRVLDMVNGRDVRIMAFGEPYDYERYPLGRVEPNLSTAKIKIVSTSLDHGFRNYKEAKDWAIEHISRTYTNDETGGKGTVNISSDVINKYVSQPARDKSETEDLHYAVLKVLPELIRYGVDAETHPNFNKVNGVRTPENGYDRNLLMHRVYSAVSVDGKVCRVKISMKENMTGKGVPTKPYSYEVTDISTEIEPLGTIDVQARSENGIPIDSISGAKLLKNVEMSYDKGRKLLDESKKMSDVIREQKGFHGSGAGFDHFDHSHMGEGEGAQLFGHGTYVSQVEGIGRTYAIQNARQEEASEMDIEEGNYNIAVDFEDHYGIEDSVYNLSYNDGGFEIFDLNKDKGVLEKWRDYFKEHPEEWMGYEDVDDFDLDSEEGREAFADDVLDSVIDTAAKIGSKYEHVLSGLHRYLYTVEIPDDTGENYVDWDKKLTDSQAARFGDAAASDLAKAEDFIRENAEDFGLSDSDLLALYDHKVSKDDVAALLGRYFGKCPSGEDAYKDLRRILGSQKAASEALSAEGVTGIKYPADYLRGGREDGALNFVVFNDKDLKITDRVRFFRTKDGEAYGFTVGGKIYIDPRIASAETAVHEYAHLLGTALKEGNPEEWKNVVKLMKDTPVWNEVREGYPELETDDEVADEVLATYSGRKGGERIDAAINEAANGDGTMLEKAAAVSALQRVKAALKRFWKGVADFLGIHFTSADDVADTVMSNFMESVNPQEALKKKKKATEGVDAGRVTDDGGKVRFSFGDDSMKGKPRRKKGESMASYVRRVRDWQHEKWVAENDPRPEMPLVDNETLDLEYGKYTRDWNKRHGLPEDYSDMGMPVRAEGESDDDYMKRIKLHERFVKERETEGDRFEEMIGFVPKAVVEYKKAVQDWEIRREQEDAARADDVLAELEKKAPKTDEASALLDYADEKAMAALGAAVGVSTDAKGAAWSTKMAIINRRKDLESMNAEDAIFLYNLRKQMEGVAASMGTTAEELDGQLPGIIELPHMIANAEGNFERAKLGQEAEPIAVAKEYLDHLQKRKKELDGNTQLQQLLGDVKRWYDEAYLLMENAGLRGDAGYVTEGYVNHVWDAAKSNAKAYDNYVRTRSGNMKHRELMTYDEGQELGLVPKFEKLTDMMAYYSRQNNQAVSNKRLLDALSRTNVQKINDDGEVIGEFPLISSVEPDFALNGEYERLEVPGIGGVWVYKPAKTTFESVFGNLRTAGIPGWMTKAARVYDKGSGTVKKWQLSFSAFHMGALIEVGAAQMGPVRVLQALGKYIVEDSFRNGTTPAFAHPEDFKDAAKHLVKLGATDDYAAADVQAMTEQLKNWAKQWAGKSDPGAWKDVKTGLSMAAVWLDFANKGLDKVLWTYIHDGLKMACFKMLKEQVMRDAAKKGWSEEKTEKMLDEAGQLVNDTFGGQYWEVIGMTPSQVKWMRRLFLSPDWLISTQRHFLANFGFGSIYSQQGFADYVKEFGKDLLHGKKPKMNDYRWLRSKAALTCYLLGMCCFLYPMFNGVNACSRYRDEQQEKEKADEIRKTNPDYKSPYELAYPDGMKWWQYTMLGNASGQQTHLFMGRYKDGTEWYARWGKQFREFPELFIGPEGFDFPTPLLNRMMGKANPVLALMRDGLGCLGVSGFKVSDPETADIIDRYGRKVAFLAMTGQHLLPFSVPTQSDKEWKWLDIVMPSSKGFSRYKAVKGFETMIVSGDMDGVAAVYRSAVMNHIDAEKCLKAAIANVEAEQRRALKDGVKDLRGAMEGFDGAKTLEEKKVMRLKILGYMTADSEKYRQFSLEEARETASMAIDGTIADAEKDNDRYLMRATSEDMRDDWKLTAVMKRTSAVEKRYREIREDEGMTDAQKEAWMEQNGKWLQARKMVQKCRSAMTKMKRGLGKGDDASLMERIREVRKRTMEELDGLDKRP